MKANAKNSKQDTTKTSKQDTAGTVKKWLSKLARMDPTSKFSDIVAALKEDHKALRKLGETLKSEDATDAEKKQAYQNFSSLLKSHSKSEEKAVYDRCHSIKNMTQEVDEGFIEHHIAETLMKNISASRNKDKWNAMVKVLAEVVEHHADEEEKELLVDLQKEFEKDEQAAMSRKFITLRGKSQIGVNDENAGILAEVVNAHQAITPSR